ncbi:hypothetical protein [Pseudomonas sp. MN1F]|uniref:hypothetical protein n=1 Tax=Pseudomonas sp. MN1F TaxID=1366632 RepID=UPI00128F11E4|nr:hypothetical protein [Pseudomonas sp. MN1F]MQG94757.1 hypothetical protein [Pseudomonas sp. MN1F]
MAIDSVLLRILRAFATFNHRISLRRLNKEEVNLIDHFRTLPERDRIAVRFMCTAIHKTSTNQPD